RRDGSRAEGLALYARVKRPRAFATLAAAPRKESGLATMRSLRPASSSAMPSPEKSTIEGCTASAGIRRRCSGADEHEESEQRQSRPHTREESSYVVCRH